MTFVARIRIFATILSLNSRSDGGESRFFTLDCSECALRDSPCASLFKFSPGCGSGSMRSYLRRPNFPDVEYIWRGGRLRIAIFPVDTRRHGRRLAFVFTFHFLPALHLLVEIEDIAHRLTRHQFGGVGVLQFSSCPISRCLHPYDRHFIVWGFAPCVGQLFISTECLDGRFGVCAIHFLFANLHILRTPCKLY